MLFFTIFKVLKPAHCETACTTLLITSIEICGSLFSLHFEFSRSTDTEVSNVDFLRGGACLLDALLFLSYASMMKRPQRAMELRLY